MIRRRYRRSGQLRRNLVGQYAELSFQARVFIQQIGESARPPLGLHPLGLLQFRTRSVGELVMGRGQPLLGDLSLADVTAAEQLSEPAPRRFPHVGDRRLRHSLARELRQSQ